MVFFIWVATLPEPSFDSGEVTLKSSIEHLTRDHVSRADESQRALLGCSTWSQVAMIYSSYSVLSQVANP